MTTMFKFTQSMTATGLTIFILGMLTFTPEIFFSGVIVMIISAAQSVKTLEAIRVEETTVQTPIPTISNENQSFYAW